MDVEGHVTSAEVRKALAKIYRGDSESNLQQAFLRVFADDLKPVDEKGHWKPSPLFILIAVPLCGLIGVFFYFTLGAAR